MVTTAPGAKSFSSLMEERRKFEPPKELGVEVITTGIVIDPIQCYDSLIKIKNVADIIIPIHDAEFLEVDKIPAD